MTQNFTTTRILRLWSTAERGIASITTVCSDGAYDSIAKSFNQTWAWFDVSESDCLHHESSFVVALRRLKEENDSFIAAVDAGIVAFAEAVAYGNDLGRVISDTELWDDCPQIEPDHRIVELIDDTLRFCVFEPKTLNSPADQPYRILRYTFDLDSLEIITQQVLSTV